MPRITKPASFSITPKLERNAKRRAKQLHRSWSSYLVDLILQDLARAEAARHVSSK